MPYHLKSSESIPVAIKRIVREELDSAVDQLLGKGGGTKEQAVHEARKSVKKIRGALRLVRPELGGAYRTENTELRDAGRRLSELRNATAILVVFDSLRKLYPDELRGQKGARIRQALVRRKHRADREAHVEDVLSQVAASLQAVQKRIKAWPLRKDGFEAIRPGLQEAFRRAKKQLAVARKNRAPEDFHEWRKNLKDHWYHVRLLENLWADVMEGYEKSLKEVESWLGDDHNLVVLREALVSDPDIDAQLCLGLIGKYQKQLRDSALSEGQRIYDEKPGQYASRMKRLWMAWQAEPKSLSKLHKKRA